MIIAALNPIPQATRLALAIRASPAAAVTEISQFRPPPIQSQRKIGRSGFKTSLVPNWYRELQWNEPLLPEDWRENIQLLLGYRTKRVTHILRNERS